VDYLGGMGLTLGGIESRLDFLIGGLPVFELFSLLSESLGIVSPIDALPLHIVI
jgi:hypothetical protein